MFSCGIIASLHGLVVGEVVAVPTKNGHQEALHVGRGDLQVLQPTGVAVHNVRLAPASHVLFAQVGPQRVHLGQLGKLVEDLVRDGHRQRHHAVRAARGCVDQLHDLVHRVGLGPEELQGLAAGRGVACSCNNSAGNVADIDGLLGGLAAVREDHADVELLAEGGQLVEEAVLVAEHVGRADDGGVGELGPHSMLAVGLCAQEFRRGLFACVEGRDVDETLDASLAAGAGQQTRAVHVHIVEGEVPCLAVLADEVDDDVGVLDQLLQAGLVHQAVVLEDHLAEVGHGAQVAVGVLVAAEGHNHLRANAAKVVDDVASEEARGAKHGGHNAAHRRAATGPSSRQHGDGPRARDGTGEPGGCRNVQHGRLLLSCHSAVE
eukprot:m.61819 g.61819  ORF g.61819 m.61819 type:complete len:377 (-) comp13747_c0_seq1:4-1134(-)